MQYALRRVVIGTRNAAAVNNTSPPARLNQHSNYKELQYPGMAVAPLLKQRRKLTGAPALFWTDKRPAEELYDMQADPEELKNLARDPVDANTLATLRSEVDRWIKETNDRGDLEETELQAPSELSNRWYRGRMKKRGLPANVDPGKYLKWSEKELGVNVE